MEEQVRALLVYRAAGEKSPVVGDRVVLSCASVGVQPKQFLLWSRAGCGTLSCSDHCCPLTAVASVARKLAGRRDLKHRAPCEWRRLAQHPWVLLLLLKR